MATERSFEAAMRICTASHSAGALSRAIPFPASRLVERGSRLNGGTARDSRWILDSPLPETSPIEEHIGYFLGLLEQHTDGLKQLPTDCSIDIWCTIFTSGEFAGFALDRALIKRLAAKGLELVFSVYTEPENKSSKK